MRKNIMPFGLLALCFFLISCAAGGNGSVSKYEPAPMAAPSHEYRIRSGDALDIKFFYHPELNEAVTVRPDGRISLQLVHEVKADGLTPEELRRTLVELYSPKISKPEIAVIPRSFNEQKVYVDGEVAKPGLVPLTRRMTALQAIAQAGGLKDTARRNEVLLIRRGAENRPVSLLVNLEKVLDGSDPGQDITLAPADIVFIPRSAIANVNVWVDQYIRKNIPIPFGFSYNIAPGQ
jgi:polysaccharide biosynthesis/export protein